MLKFLALGGALLLGPSQAFEEVKITATEFRPSTVEVVVGQRIFWNNISKEAQTVTSGAAPGETAIFNSGPIRPGSTFELRFDSPGIYEYHSDLDPSFVGTVIVSERP